MATSLPIVDFTNFVTPGEYSTSGAFCALADGSRLVFRGATDACFTVNVPGYLTVGANVKVSFTGGAGPENLTWNVAGYLTLGASVEMKGIMNVKGYATFGAGSVLIGKLQGATAVTYGASAEVIEPPSTSHKTKLLLLSKDVMEYELFAKSVQEDVTVVIYDRDVTIGAIMTSIAEKNVARGSLEAIGWVAHEPRYLFGRPWDLYEPLNGDISTLLGPLEAMKTLLKPERTRVDLLQCSLMNNRQFCNLQRLIRVQTGMDIAASWDLTGANDKSNWILESHGQLDAKEIYFTDEIDKYDGSLAKSDDRLNKSNDSPNKSDDSLNKSDDIVENDPDLRGEQDGRHCTLL
jgi:hypothetical protein